jgi:hypothetical protein
MPELKQYLITGEMRSTVETRVWAEDDDHALELAEEMDGGELEEVSCSWSFDSVEQLSP